jgi:hypothetical protein
MLRRTFEPKWDEVTGGWRKLHNQELHNLYSSPSIIRMIKSRRMRLAGHVECKVEEEVEEKKNAYKILVGKPEGMKPLERPGHRWVYDIKMDLRETGWGGTKWIDLGQDRTSRGLL